MDVAEKTRAENAGRPLARHERAHLALVAEMMVLPLTAWARDALDGDDAGDIAAATAAIEAKLPWINDVLATLGRRPLDMARFSGETPAIRLRLAVLTLATETIAGR